MHKITFLIFLTSTFFVFAEEKVRIKVGVTGAFEIAKSYQSNKQYELSFIKDSFDSRLVNKLISGDIDVAILPAEYALKVFWYGKGFALIGKTGKCYHYLLSSKKVSQKVMMVKNSGSEYFFTKFFKKNEYEKVYRNTIEIQKKLNHKIKHSDNLVDAVLVDAGTYRKLDKNQKNYRVTKVDAGTCLIVSLEQNKNMLIEKSMSKMFKVNKLDHRPMSNEDFSALEELNLSLNKSKSAQENSQLIFNR